MEEKNKHIDFQLLTKYIAGESTADEQKEVTSWLAESEANRKEYEELVKVWNALGTTDSDQAIDIDKEWNSQKNLQNSNSNTRRLVPLRNFILIAASIILVFGLSVIGLKNFNRESIKTQYAETLQSTLPDGSRITLNSGSKLQYSKNFSEGDRRVTLQGEAYFEVTADSSRPFIIALNGAEIRVLGTAFNVKAYKKSDKIEVTVTEGKVSLYEKDKALKQVIAVKGEKAEYNRSEQVVKKVQNSDQNFLSWKTRLLVFENDDLSEVIKTIEEVYHQQIELRNSQLEGCKINTRFEDKDLNTVLRVIESTLDITAEEEKGVIYLDGSGCE